MLHTTSHQRNGNKNHDISLPLVTIKKTQAGWECRIAQSLWKSVWRFLRKLKINPPNDPDIPLPDTWRNVSLHTIETPAHPCL
jgi:hypothetical protein